MPVEEVPCLCMAISARKIFQTQKAIEVVCGEAHQDRTPGKPWTGIRAPSSNIARKLYCELQQDTFFQVIRIVSSNLEYQEKEENVVLVNTNANHGNGVLHRIFTLSRTNCKRMRNPREV